MRGVLAIALAGLLGLAVPVTAQATDLPVKAPPQEQVVLPPEAPIYDPLLIAGVAGAAALLLLIHEGHGGNPGTCPGVNCGPPVSPN